MQCAVEERRRSSDRLLQCRPSLEKSHSVQELEKGISCTYCGGVYSEPKVLTCMHYFCKDCIHSMAMKRGITKPFPCPDCLTSITLPPEGIDSLKPAFFITHMKRKHSKLSLAQGKMEGMCESCSEERADAFCRKCSMFICGDCIRSHRKMRVFSDHNITSLKELREHGGEEVLLEKNAYQNCSKHDEEMKIYCFDCQMLICRDCTIKDHKDHDHEFVNLIAPQIKRGLLKQLVPLKNVKDNFSCAVEEVQATKAEVEAQVHTVNMQIQNFFEEVQKILLNRKQDLMKESKTRGAEKMKVLAEQEKKLVASSMAIQSVIDYTEQCIEHSPDDEMMTTHKEIQNRIEKEIAGQECNYLHPVEEADMGVEMAGLLKELRQLALTKAKLILLNTEVTISGGGPRPKSAEVNKKCEIVFVATLGDGKQMKRKFYPVCYLKSLLDGTISKCEFFRANNIYCIQFTPTVRGRHEIAISSPGLKIEGAPFPVFASVYPTQLVEPIQVITEGFDERPNYVAINSKGDMIVTGHYNVTSFNSKQRVECVDLRHEYGVLPFGLAVDRDDIIYIPCRASKGPGSYLIKLTPKLSFVKISEKIEANFWDVSIVGKEVMVCDEKEKSIMVFNKELSQLRSFNITQGELKKLCMTSDGYGNLYVCGSDSPILVFTGDGQYLRSFTGKNLGVPNGICVAGDYIYVSDYATQDVLAYTVRGKFVSSFREHSTCQFARPFGVWADKDGFIYICDNGNKRVVVF